MWHLFQIGNMRENGTYWKLLPSYKQFPSFSTRLMNHQRPTCIQFIPTWTLIGITLHISLAAFFMDHLSHENNSPSKKFGIPCLQGALKLRNVTSSRNTCRLSKFFNHKLFSSSKQIMMQLLSDVVDTYRAPSQIPSSFGQAPPLLHCPVFMLASAWELLLVGNQRDNTWSKSQTFKLTSLSLFPS